MRSSLLGLAAPLINFTPASSVQAFALGTRSDAGPEDPSSTANVPNGGGTFIYVKSDAARVVGEPVILTKDFITAQLPNTAATGQPVYICANNFTAASQYGWVMAAGIAPVKVSAATVAGPLYISGAGTVSGAQANGKQIVGIQALVGSIATFTKTNCKTFNGTTQIKVSSTEGLYVGLSVSGTGVGASAKITDIDEGGKLITVDVASTANGTNTLTFTHTGYVIAAFEAPHVQPQIV